MDSLHSPIAPFLLLFIPSFLVFVLFGCARIPEKKRVDRSPPNVNQPESKSQPKTPKFTKSDTNVKENQTQGDGMDWNTVNLNKNEEPEKTDLDVVDEEDVWKNKTVRATGNNKNVKEDKKTKKKSTRKLPSTVSVYTAESDTPANKEAKRVNNEKNALKTVETLKTVSVYQDETQLNTKTVEEIAKNKGAKEKSKSSTDKPRVGGKKKSKKDKTETQKTTEVTKSKFDTVQKTTASKDGETERTEEPNWDEEKNEKSAQGKDKKGNKKADFKASTYLQ